MEALAQVDGWPATTVAVGVVGPDGVLDRRGPADRPFALASVTKLLTACAVLVAVEEGTVGLDDPAGPPGSTVRHLLAHASGLPPEGQAPVAAPGTRRIYSNTGFEAVAAHVEQRAGIPFRTYLDEAVLEPLGMGATTLEGSPAWGARASLDDLLRFAGLLDPALRTDGLPSPELLDPRTLAEATRPAFPGLRGVLPGFGPQDPNDWGLGFELRDGKSPHWTGSANSARTFGHFGRSGTFLWVDPEAHLACVGLTDHNFGPWAVEAWPRLADAVLAEHRAV